MKWKCLLIAVSMSACSQLYDPPPTEPDNEPAPVPSETDDGYEDGGDDGDSDTGGDDNSGGAEDCPEELQSCSQARGALDLLPGLPVAGGLLGTIGNLLGGLPLLDILAPSNTEVCGHTEEAVYFETADQSGLIEQLTGGLLADGWSPLGEAELDVCALLQLFTKNGDVLRLIADADGLVQLAL